MHIGIDMSRTAEPKTGLGSYASSLVAALARVDRDNRYTIYPWSWHCFVDEFDRAFCPRAPNFQRARSWVPAPIVRRLWQRGRTAQRWLHGRTPDLYFSPFHCVPLEPMGKLVCVWHDVAFLTHPEYADDWNREFCSAQLAESLRRADRILTVSEHSKRELVARAGFAPDLVDVVLEAADPRFEPRDDLPLPARVQSLLHGREYLLFVGSVEPRKNLTTLVRAHARLGPQAPPLLVAGGSGWKNSALFAEIEQRGWRERVHFLGFVTDEELVALYNHATLFVYPSVYEGFGLPVVEAMACACPVVTSRTSSLPEVGGDAVAYIDDPFDDVRLAERIAELLGDPAQRRDLAWRGRQRAGTFSWERAARETLAVFARTLQTQHPRHEFTPGADERALGEGWHGLEQTEGVPFRWTMRQATLLLDVAHGGLLELEAASPLPDHRLRIHTGTGDLGEFLLTGGWQTFRAELRNGSAPPIRLELDRALPQEMLGGDARELGIMVRRARIVPRG